MQDADLILRGKLANFANAFIVLGLKPPFDMRHALLLDNT
jgi:hypothetical protein